MNNLNLIEMEAYQGGSVADCVGAVAGGMEMIGGFAAAVALGAGPVGWALLGIGAIALTASVWDGDPCEEFAG